jgi:hypothetical protein
VSSGDRNETTALLVDQLMTARTENQLPDGTYLAARHGDKRSDAIAKLFAAVQIVVLALDVDYED